MPPWRTAGNHLHDHVAHLTPHTVADLVVVNDRPVIVGTDFGARRKRDVLIAAALLSLAGALSVVSHQGLAWRDARFVILDSLPAVVLVLAGLRTALTPGRWSTGVLLLASGLAWPTAEWLSRETGSVAVGALPIGLVGHAIITFPDGHPRGRERLILPLPYAAALSIVILPTAAPLLAAGLVVAAIWRVRRSFGPDRRARTVGVWLALAFASLLVAHALVVLLLGRGTVALLESTFYPVLVTVLGATTAWLAIASPWLAVPVTDLVVELGERSSTSLRAALAEALGDATVAIAYRLADTDRWVDDSGRQVARAVRSEPGVVVVERDGHAVAAIRHDPERTDTDSLQAVGAALELSRANAALAADLRDQAEALADAGRRLVAAGDDERARLAIRLDEGATHDLRDILSTLRVARDRAVALDAASIAGAIEAASSRTADTLDDIDRFGRGLRPRILAERGLADALGASAESMPAAITVSAPTARFDPEIETTLFFVASEGLANAVKHGGPSHIRVEVTETDEAVSLLVADDGMGGAFARPGSGLERLADRVEAMGGRLEIDSPHGAGTRLVARIPDQRGAPAALNRP